MNDIEPTYDSYNCLYSLRPCEECPFVKCKNDSHMGVRELIGRERRRLFQELHGKGFSARMIGMLFGVTAAHVRHAIAREKE